MDLTEKKHFCAIPFHHLNIGTNGDYNVCCIHQPPKEHVMNIKHHSCDDWAKSEYLQDVRKSFLDDHRHSGCRACWNREDLGFTSLRIRTEKEYQILKVDTEHPLIKNVEINLGNLCNLKCLMCNEENSSAILAENQRLGINQANQNDFKWDDVSFQNLEKILQKVPKVVNIRGGEPFYNNRLLEIVQNIPEDRARTMILHITTNATTWNEKWKQALSKFRMVRIMVSVDAVGDLYEYIRYPANWNVVEKNILEMAQVSNFKLLVHCVVQNLNVSAIGSLINWCDRNNLYLEFEKISVPSYLSIENLPDLQKQQAMDHLLELALGTLPDHLLEFVESSLKFLDSSDFDEFKWKLFLSNITRRDQLRNNSYQTFIKE